MNEFWNNELQPGYYDHVLERSLKNKKDIQGNWHEITFEKISFYLIKNKKHLDYACGPGTLIGRYSNSDSIGVDISENQIKYAREKYEDKKFLEIKDFNFNEHKEYFDIITIIGLFEFLNDDEIIELLNKLLMNLKSGGKILITTPNFSFFFKFIIFLQNIFSDVNYKKLHVNKVTSKKLKKLLTRNNFTSFNISKILNFGVFFSIISNKFGKKLNQTIRKISRSNLGYLIFIELEKK